MTAVAEHSLPELAGKKVTLSYSPATQEDEDVINSYLPEPHPDGTPIDPSELPTSLPAYLINLKPELRIEGDVVASGGAVTMGTAEDFRMTFQDPSRGSDIVNNVIEAGEYWGISINVSSISQAALSTVKERLHNTISKLELGDFAGLMKEAIVGDQLYTAALYYNSQADMLDLLYSYAKDVIVVRYPSQAIFKNSLKVENSYGVPISISSEGLAMDVDRQLSIVKSPDGKRDKILGFMLASGINSSTLEHIIPEQLFNLPNHNLHGISTSKVLQIAAKQNIPIYTINRNNITSIIQSLALDEFTINEIRNVVNSGNEVIVPQSSVNIDGWVGCGYVVFDPVTGNGAYMISTGLNGGDWWWNFEYHFWNTLYILALATAMIAAVLAVAIIILLLPEIAAIIAGASLTVSAWAAVASFYASQYVLWLILSGILAIAVACWQASPPSLPDESTAICTFLSYSLYLIISSWRP